MNYNRVFLTLDRRGKDDYDKSSTPCFKKVIDNFIVGFTRTVRQIEDSDTRSKILLNTCVSSIQQE